MDKRHHEVGRGCFIPTPCSVHSICTWLIHSLVILVENNSRHWRPAAAIGKRNTPTSHPSTNWTTTMLSNRERSTCTPCSSWRPRSLWSISHIPTKLSILWMYHCTTCSIDNFSGSWQGGGPWHHFHNQERSQEEKPSEIGWTSSVCVRPA